MSAAFDLVIVGAGPAGMSAAIAARGLGLSVAVVDEQSHAGGQIHRAVELAHAAGRAPYAHDAFGLALVAAYVSRVIATLTTPRMRPSTT